jgi:hypothetical protein
MEVSRRLPRSRAILPANGATVTGIAMTGSDRSDGDFWLEERAVSEEPAMTSIVS